MNSILKIAIVAALVVAVGAVLAMKGSNARSKETQVTPEVAKPEVKATIQRQQAAEPTAAKKLPRLVDLGANKCIPCKAMKPILDELRATYAGTLDVVFIDVWENPNKGKEYGINIIPTQIFYDAGGKELFRHEGFFSRADILAKWKEFGVDLDTAASK
jgi:thioredoxin 1